MKPETNASVIMIRAVDEPAELRAIEELQKEVWGIPEREVTPMTHFIAARAVGGVLLGAFDGADLVGFVYGFPGYEDGQPTHHSHLLAVKPQYRSLRLGQKLKLAQRERVLAQGIKLMTWTFDPLQSRNAHLNFKKLGALSNRYLVNFYGAEAASFLHRHGTDRLWVRWPLASYRVCERVAQIDTQTAKNHVDFDAIEFERLPLLVRVGDDESPQISDADDELKSENVLIEIPSDINALAQSRAATVLRWRDATRRAFTRAFANGFVIEDFYRRTRGVRLTGVYWLRRAQADF